MNVVIAITGASGSIYAKKLIEKLALIKDQVNKVGIVLSDNAREIWEKEIGELTINIPNFTVYNKNDFYATFASGSSNYERMIVCPCSMGVLGRIAHGVSDDLITRAADVILKEQRKLVLVTRETPLSLIHLENMRLITLAGGIIFPANPSYYFMPKSIDELAENLADRILQAAGFIVDMKRWGELNV